MIRKLALVLALVAVLLAPSVVRAQSAADLIVADLDAYWSTQFAERGLPYSSPRFSVVDYPGMEMCGFLDMFDAIGAYCSSGSTLTLSSGYVDPNDIVSVLTILSHEYGHHIQNMADTGISSVLESELQADCFGGAFISYAEDAGWISPAVAAQAMQLTQSAGDVWWEAPGQPNDHGTKADRVIAWWAGYNGGLAACGF